MNALETDTVSRVGAATAQVICDSTSPAGIRLATLQLRYPRIIHSEFMTHRVFSRNARSSRAVPVTVLLDEAEDHPFIPKFMANRPGMQATEALDATNIAGAEQIWEDLAMATVDACRQLTALGVHKQWANRPLEWFTYIDVLVTSTEWANFFALRQDGGAQPEMQDLANAMWAAMHASQPTVLQPLQWHLPFITDEEQTSLAEYGENRQDVRQAVSAARCARISYKPFDGNADIVKELERYDLLVGSAPVHASPVEHQATPDIMHENDWCEPPEHSWLCPEDHGNFYGWRQFRKVIPNEAVRDR